MSLVTLKELMREAEKNHYAVGAFNTNNMEIVQAIVEAAEEERSPVILQASQGALKYAGIDYIVAMVEAAAKNATVPVCLHLDHGDSFEQVVLCVRKGFSSVMVDGSKHPLEENIAITSEIVRFARPCGLSVEGELGRIGGTEDNISVSDKEKTMTVPEEAKEFCDRTGVDALAVSIGNAHGQYKGKPELDFNRLAAIKDIVTTPLVLHGASGIPAEDIREAVKIGVSKINIDTEIRLAFQRGVKEFVANNPNEYDPRKILGAAKKEMKEIVKAKMRLFGSSGRA